MLVVVNQSQPPSHNGDGCADLGLVHRDVVADRIIKTGQAQAQAQAQVHGTLRNRAGVLLYMVCQPSRPHGQDQ